MKERLLHDVTLLSPGAKHHAQVVSVHMQAGRVVRINEKPFEVAGVSSEHVAGKVLAPAFADLYLQLTDPGYEWRAMASRLAQEAYLGGYADVLCQPNTLPVIDKADMVLALRARMGQFATRFHFAGCLSVEAAGKDMAELYELHQAGVLAFSDGLHPVQDAGLLIRCLRYLRPFQALVMQLPNDSSIAGKGLANESLATAALGLRGIPPLAEEMAISRDLKVLEYTGGRMHFSPITTAGSVQLIAQAKARGLNVTASTAPQYLLFDDSALGGFDPCYKVIPPLRTLADVAACRSAVAAGVIDSIASHHTPMALEDKAVEFDFAENGMATLASSFAMCNTTLVASGLMPLDALIEKMAIAPCQLLGLPLPVLNEGSEAYALLLDPNEKFSLESVLPFGGYHNYPGFLQPLFGTVTPLFG